MTGLRLAVAGREARLQRKLAEVTSERDFLRERLLELVEELDTAAAKWQRAPGQRPGVRQSRFVAYTTAAAKLRRIVTESKGGDNHTAT